MFYLNLFRVVYVRTYLFGGIPFGPSACVSVGLYFHQSVSLSVYISVGVFLRQGVSLSGCKYSAHLTVIVGSGGQISKTCAV